MGAQSKGILSESSKFGAGLESVTLSDGQRRRLELFKRVEQSVCSRIEQLCMQEGIPVVDVAVLVLSPEARGLVFDDEDEGGADGITVVLGHRDKLYGFLHAAMPEAEDALVDPYEDLLAPAPALCVRVLIVDGASITVMSYGTFVTVELARQDMPQA